MAQWKSHLLAALAGLLLPGTAHAQIFWKSPEFAAPPMAALDPVFDGNFTGITRAETDAIILWNLRSALNLAALQCGFEPLLRTVPNYNGMLFNHKDELSAAYLQIQGYFKRTKKAAAQSAMDQFATRLISRYSTVGEFAAYKAEQILFDGKKAGEIPIETLTRHSLIVNLSAVRRLHTYPPLSILRLAELIDAPAPAHP